MHTNHTVFQCNSILSNVNANETEIVVVGGGPAGLISAKTAAAKGRSVILFDSKDKIGFHEHCAGLLSIQGLKDLNLEKLPSGIIQNNSIKGAIIFSPSGKSITVEKEQPTAYVVNREKFNIHLYNLATEVGVNTETSSRVLKVERENKSLILKLGKKNAYRKVVSRIAILAEGRFPQINKQIGLPIPSRNSIVFSSMYMMKNLKDINPNFVEIYQDQRFAPGFFTWIIPTSDTTAKVGLASTNVPARNFLNLFIQKHPIARKKLENAVIEKRTNGAIPLGSFIRKTFTDNIMVVGDAAGQTKPTTGGGVIFGGVAAQFAGQIASDAIIQERYDARFLSQYSKLWKRKFSSNLTIMRLVRNYLNSLNEKEINRLLLILNNPKVKHKISEKGDVDNQKKIVMNLLTEMRLWPFIIKTGFKFLLNL